MPSDEQMTPEQLRDFKQRVAMLSAYTLEAHYREHLERCRLRPGFIPSPRMIQEFVSMWKQLWMWKKK
jgi:hypothetical protein